MLSPYSSLRVGRNGCKRDTTPLLSCAVIMQSFSVVLRTPSSRVFLGEMIEKASTTTATRDLSGGA
jgi:hypothetical protein